MSILAFDIGGTAVKYGLFKDNQLQKVSSFPTPDSWEEMKESCLAVKDKYKNENLKGVAISSPGSVDVDAGVIHGISAVPYIHHFPILKAFEECLGLPVSIENDANCAALAEVAFGVAKVCQNALFFIIGSGLGGAVVIDRKLHKGRNLFGGEFGNMLLDDGSTLSERVSPVHVAKRFSKERSLGTELSGKELFDLADRGDSEAQQAVEGLLDSLALAIFNTCLVVNPDVVAIGGGISQRRNLATDIQKRVEQFKQCTEATDLDVEIATCHYFNDANLLGAVAHFLNRPAK